MKIEKLNANSYRVRQQYKGKRYTVVFDHKPTQKEVAIAIAEKMGEFSSNSAKSGTIDDYAKKYISLKESEGKSPATLRGYISLRNNIPEWFSSMNILDVDNDYLQRLVNEYSKTHSAKSTSNMYGFVRSILVEYRQDIVIRVKLPTKEKKYEYEPSTKDVMAILDYASGSRYSIFLQLSVLGLRRGEIGALTLDDLSGDNILTINKDMVVDTNNNQVIKDTPKTNASNRRILIPAPLAEEIRSQGYIFKGNLHTVNEFLHKAQDKLNIPRFRLHVLRHFAAAYLNKMGFTRDQIIEYCGWEKSSNIMDRVYSYNLDPEETQKEIATAFNGLFS